MASFRQLLKAKEEELIQRKRKTSADEHVDRKPKRRRQSKENSEGIVAGADLLPLAEPVQALSDVSEQPEDAILEEKHQIDSPDDLSKETVAKIKREKEKRNLEMRVEVCESCGSREGCPLSCIKCKVVYHLECIKEIFSIESNTESFMCPTCNPSTNIYCCLCQQTEGEMLCCSFKLCGRRYHRNCLNVFHSPSVRHERPSSQFICPAHYCHTCVAELNELHQPEKKLLRCIHCPTSYHPSNYLYMC